MHDLLRRTQKKSLDFFNFILDELGGGRETETRLPGKYGVLTCIGLQRR